MTEAALIISIKFYETNLFIITPNPSDIENVVGVLLQLIEVIQ